MLLTCVYTLPDGEVRKGGHALRIGTVRFHVHKRQMNPARRRSRLTTAKKPISPTLRTILMTGR